MFALITGAATGMGTEYARQLAAKGYNLILADINPAVQTVADTIAQQYGVTVHTQIMDLGTPDAAEELFQYCKTNNLTVEVLVNNAGVYHDRDILDDSLAFNTLILHLHVTTPALLCRLFAEEMKKRKKGYILNVSSITAHMPIQRLGTYASTKAFLSHFSRSLHIELKEYGIAVLSVHPGAVDTGLYSIPSWLTKIGLSLGVVVSPRYLVRRALRALFNGRAAITVPWLWSKVTILLVCLLPTGLLCLIRRLRLF